MRSPTRRKPGALVLGAALALVAAFFVAPLAAQAPPPPPGPETAILQGLDKVTARISTFAAPVGERVRFGTLEIVVRRCDKRPPTEPPESAAFIEIADVAQFSTPLPVFSGWMFASSPALSALEHPVYDVWVIDCTNASS